MDGGGRGGDTPDAVTATVPRQLHGIVTRSEVPADRGATRSVLRDLDAPQDDVRHGHRLGSRVCLAIESDRAGHLLLLDEGTSGKIYCLRPSVFAPETRLAAGRAYLPRQGSRYDAFVVSGQPGRVYLLALRTDKLLGLDWTPNNPKVPARVLSPADSATLLARLRDRNPTGGRRWPRTSTGWPGSRTGRPWRSKKVFPGRHRNLLQYRNILS